MEIELISLLKLGIPQKESIQNRRKRLKNHTTVNLPCNVKLGASHGVGAFFGCEWRLVFHDGELESRAYGPTGVQPQLTQEKRNSLKVHKPLEGDWGLSPDSGKKLRERTWKA